ncbi:MAG: hypothetical protein M1816_005114 [Peltula sp. TS41687]|nr:MAG: hypothetical protein M1816_005114 [Peltula sp. TS41687]
MSHLIFQRPPMEPYRDDHETYLEGSSSFMIPHLPQAQQATRSTLRVPYQYALPLHRSSRFPSNGPGSSSTLPPSTQGAEHILRRKTPNGTLAAGYDGRSIEWTSRPHAIKHMLLPMPDKSSQPHMQSSLTPGSNGSTSLRHSHATSIPPSYTRLDGTEMAPQNAVPTDGMKGLQQLQQLNTWQAVGPQYARGMDSLINQGPMLQASTYFSPNGVQVPAILQALYQPCPGPTASNSVAPYGPYWPDGAFIPYRPAAQTGHGGSNWIDGVSSAHLGFGSHLVPHSGIIHYPDGQTPAAGPYPIVTSINPPSLNYPYGASSSHVPLGSVHENVNGAQAQASHSVDQRLNHQLYSNRPSSFGGIPSQGNPADIRRNPGSTFNAYSTPALNHVERQLLTNTSGWRSNNYQFKDKLLAWAHGVYVDLLASVHQARNNSHRHPVDGNRTQQRLPRIGIFPKPPRQPSFGVGFSQPDSATQWETDAPNASPALDGVYNSPNQQHGWPHTFNQLRAQVSKYDQSVHAGCTNESGTMRPSSSKLDSSPVPMGNVLNILIGTVLSNAMTALELISGLCAESAWAWIDGMLLAGCLAYGLGNYNDALTWYSKILEIDSNHVEAISNLAATLLSLHRRDEAEQYWLRAVKLRPSYFEAVEHLIGLLCSVQRGREAVNIIQFVERSLRNVRPGEVFKSPEQGSESGSEASGCSSIAVSDILDRTCYDPDGDDGRLRLKSSRDWYNQPGIGSSGYRIPDSENGRILALIHAKGNMLYSLGDNHGAARAFEDVVLIAAGKRNQGVQGLIERILSVMASESATQTLGPSSTIQSSEPVLLLPDKALQTARMVFSPDGELPGLAHVPNGMSRKAAISTTSNSLLSLAKIFQDGLSAGASNGPKPVSGIRDILALYYLSLSLQRSPSTANNVGILLASVQQSANARVVSRTPNNQLAEIPGVVPGSGVALALAYYNYGLNLDSRHAHLYTNLGSLLKDIGQLSAAVRMYEQAVSCDGNFDIALANLANAVKDQGRISDAIRYYKRAVAASPEFAEAVCGLANALNSVCGWTGRGGEARRERWHVDENGMLTDARSSGSSNSGWMKRVIDIVERQLAEGEKWGKGVVQSHSLQPLLEQLEVADAGGKWSAKRRRDMELKIKGWMGQPWEGARIVRLVERAIKRLGWQWYQDKYRKRKEPPLSGYVRPQLPLNLSVPTAPTVLPFHTFTCPLSAKQIRMISHRNGLRISCSILRSHWLPEIVFSPPAPPAPHLNVGYVSSDFNNHPLAHLMQSVFGFHNPTRVRAFCYATTASDQSIHRRQIEREAPVFHDASGWSAERLVKQIVQDGIHILVNLNGYTRGARNEIFAARPAPIQMSFMGFAGTLGAEWCDYLLADETAIPRGTLRPSRRNVNLDDQILADDQDGEKEDWVYSENIIFSRDTFFCCDHRQSAPDSQDERLSWNQEQARRWTMRKELFPGLPDDTIILANFNQLYKIDPGTFRSWLRILARIPNAVLWLLRFPDLGESNLKRTAELWAGQEVASRVLFTDVAPKHQHISRARVCDLFLDTPECNAHTTAADVLWSGTPILTLPRYKYKMCSRMAASILRGALPKTAEGEQAAEELIAGSEAEYEDRAVRLGKSLEYGGKESSLGPQQGKGTGRLMELRRILYESRWTSALFDTRRWVRDLEEAYEKVWERWVAGEGGDIWL